MQNTHSNVDLSKAYTIWFWFTHIVACLVLGSLFGAATENSGTAILVVFILTTPPTIWYKKAVLNRTKIIFENGTNKVTYQRGRWFVRDEDIIPVKSIDNVKLDRSLLGKILGYCHMSLETRGNEPYKLKAVSTKQAERFRDAFIEMA